MYVPDLHVVNATLPRIYYCEVCEKKFTVNEQYNLVESEDANAQSIRSSPSKKR